MPWRSRPPRRNRALALAGLTTLAACWSPNANRESADEQVYSILQRTAESVTLTC